MWTGPRRQSWTPAAIRISIELQRKLLELLDCNPFSHDEIELEMDGE